MSTCDAACQAKILLNAGRVRSEAQASVELTTHLRKNDLLTAAEGQQLINIFDEAEDKLVEFNNRLLAKTGYTRKTQKFELEKLNE